MKKRKTMGIAACSLSLLLCLAACAPKQPAETTEQPAQSTQSTETTASLTETESSAEATTEAMPEATGEAWERELQGMYDDIAAVQAKYPPEIRTLASGVEVQRTPADAMAYNMRILHADERGCAACHPDLGQTLADYDEFSSPNFYKHFEMTGGLDTEVTVRQCYLCHKEGLLGTLQTSIHGLHDTKAFKDMDGDCRSCHVTDEVTGEMLQWDEAKYRILKGVTSLAESQWDAEFSYDQDVLTEDVFGLNWMYYPGDTERMSHWYAGDVPNPEEDGVYEEWTITVTGDVEEEKVFTLQELIDQAPSVTKIQTLHCAINPVGGPFISTAEITGIPLTWLPEQAGVKEGANIYFCGNDDNMAYTQDLAALEERPAYLVYKINGEPVSYLNGYPVVAWMEGGTAADGRKQITRIEVVTGDWEEYQAYIGPVAGGGYRDGTYENWPNVGYCHLRDGQIIKAYEPYTFEGYAQGFYDAIEMVEISLDGGVTWKQFDTSDADCDRWVYWKMTWTPPAEGSYIISLRATDEAGRVTTYPLQKLITVK